MKPAENNEMDLLLRNLAKQRRRASGSQIEGSFAQTDQAAGYHLEADELSSYAEGVLPPAARARYSAHLADCSRCRGIVSRLTIASGAVVSNERVRETSHTTVWKYLGSFFSPSVLRYAIPALSLVAFVAVSILVLKRERSSEFVAQNQPATSTPETMKHENGQSATVNEKLTTAKPSTESSKSSVSIKNEVADKKPKSEIESETAATGSEEKKHEAKAAATPTVEQRRVFAPELAATPPPRPAAADKEKARQETGRERDQVAIAELPARKDDERKSREKAEPSAGVAGAVKSAPAPTRNVQGLTTTGARQAKTAENEAQTRTIAGRRFRREGNAWVDTAYHSSTATTNLTRGSEQYRALIADEPEIRTIAQQLEGEFVVVWKGRAYRIR